MIRKLLAAALIVLALLIVADIGARLYSQHQLAQRIDDAQPGAHARVQISGFPFLGKLMASGRVDKITAHLDHAGQGQFVLDTVDITVVGARINRNNFVRNRRLEIDRITTGAVVATMSQADFDRLVGLPVVFDQGSAHAVVAGVTVTARVAIVNNRLVASGLPVSIPVPSLPVLPCAATVTIVPGHLRASCIFQQVPPALRIVSL
jgi:hypothetical protein